MDVPQPPKPPIVAAGPTEAPRAGGRQPDLSGVPFDADYLPPGRPAGWNPFTPQLTARQKEYLARIEEKNRVAIAGKNSAGNSAKKPEAGGK